MTIDEVLWLLAAISWACGAFGLTLGRVNWLLLGLMFVAMSFVL